jgi:hypothetical protein
MPNRRHFIALAAAAAALVATPAFAIGSLVGVDIVDRSQNELLPVYQQRGTAWVAGRPGSSYAVRLSNRSGARVMVVLSVDGINAVTGETAGLGQVGYVLMSGQSTEITGWRKSLTEAAAFYFTALPDSYAARTDRPDNVGVIGVAVFRERQREPEVSRRSSDSAEPSVAQNADRARGAAESSAPAPSPSAAKALGTGHGEREYMPTSHTHFERASDRPNELVRLRYDSHERLLASGVIRSRRAPWWPEPFPGFVPDPKG